MITKNDLKKQLSALGVSIYKGKVKRSEIQRILSENKVSMNSAEDLFKMIGGLSRIAKELKKESSNKDVLVRHLEEIVHNLDVWAEKMV